MANNAYKIISFSESKNRETGEITKYVNVEEAIPRRIRLNISRQNAAFITELNAFIGKGLMLDTRDGVTESGFPFTTLVSDSLMPIDLDYTRRKAAQESIALVPESGIEVINDSLVTDSPSVAVNDEPAPKAKMFGSSK